jgi:hypothetical protein
VVGLAAGAHATGGRAGGAIVEVVVAANAVAGAGAGAAVAAVSVSDDGGRVPGGGPDPRGGATVSGTEVGADVAVALTHAEPRRASAPRIAVRTARRRAGRGWADVVPF